ncbi:hypothetical protein CPS_2361 [Colwellia psychrerythraea 34H]|uniref:Uncharacterized protein n=1 Tax=Colwellia psychrerythraea (strain 34H / ATCC BAA-681) TaxID=167879 RepID=Q482D9_COLP3|nr:hypothetical protein CPS_2361 [Colwellia psychrerythraea 34H]
MLTILALLKAHIDIQLFIISFGKEQLNIRIMQ